MGQAESTRDSQSYVVPNSALPPKDGKPGSSAIYRSKLAPQKFVESYDTEVRTLWDNFNRGVRLSPSGPCLGTRSLNPDGTRGAYQWQTYAQAHQRMEHFGSGLVSECGLQPGATVGIYSINRAEWVVAEYGAYSQRLVVVSLYDTLGAESVAYILSQAEISTVVCSKDKIAKLLEVAEECKQLKTIIQMEREGDPEIKKKCEARGLRLVSFAEIEDKPPRPPGPTDLCTIMYTSGTTGLPKGVLLSHANVLSDVAALKLAGVILHPDDVTISYLPLAHIFERVVVAMACSSGAAIGFYQGDVLKLFDDIQQLRPTLFPSVPRLFNRLYDKVLQTIEAAGSTSKALFDWAYASKKERLDTGANPEHALWDAVVFSKLRAKLGGRVRIIVTGSAPISANVYQFLQICFGCTVLQGYGLTETCAGLTLTLPGDWRGGHVGPPLANFEVKLEDVPEMGYAACPAPAPMPTAGEGNAARPPQGEVCVRGPGLFLGYFKQPDKTKEVMDDGGWFHTGDVGQWNADGTLSIIDRKKNIFKLAQGEYVAAEFLEQVYGKNRLVAQVFVYGDSLQSCLVAVVVPNFETLVPRAAAELGLTGLNEEALCQEEKVRRLLQEELVRTAREAKLKGFELLKALHLEARPFSVENGLLTPTFKPKRADLFKRYQREIAALYAAIVAATPPEK